MAPDAGGVAITTYPTRGAGERILARTAYLPVAVLAASSIAMLAILVFVGRWMTFWWDEWLFIFNRPDPSARSILAPVFDTFAGLPIMVYQALLATVGLRSYWPYLAVDWIGHFAIALLLYRIVARRSGPILGTAASVAWVFMGVGFEQLLQPFQIQYTFAIIGGLVAIDQIDCRRPVVAAIALVPAVASSGLGVIFTGLVLLWGLLRRDRSTILATAPAIAVYAAWYVTWGRESLRLPGPGLGPLDAVYSVAYGLGATVAGTFGLPPARSAGTGAAIIVGGLVALVVAWRRGYRPEPLAAAAVAALLAEQLLRVALRGQYGVNYGQRSAYVYAGVVFVWLAIGALVRDRLPRHPVVPAIAAVAVVAIAVSSMWQFYGAVVVHREWRATEIAELRLVESVRADPRLDLNATVDSVRATNVRPAPYFAAIDRFGAPSLPYDSAPYVDAAAVAAARERVLAP